jgi:hypothetical protein
VFSIETSLTNDGKMTLAENFDNCGKNLESKTFEIHCCVRLSEHHAPVAQWIEHPPPKGRVTRSIRVGGTN